MRSRATTVVATCVVLLLRSAALLAQGAVTRAVQSLEARAADNLTATAEAMPEDRYAFRPTPAQMSFGELVLHSATTNFTLCSGIAGVSLPERPNLSGTDRKDLLVARLAASFDLCGAALEHDDDSFLEDSVAFIAGRRVSRGAALVVLAVDWADHYGQLMIYLQLNGLEPPPPAKRE